MSAQRAPESGVAADAAPGRPSGRRRSPLLVWLAGFVAVLIVAEVGVRLASPILPEPLRYYSADSQRFVDDMDVLQRAGVKSDLAFVGTSMVRRDVDATEIKQLIPGIKWAQNVALPGAQTPIVENWMLDQVVPRIHPKTVVWGISSLDFNDGRPDKPIEQYDAARQTQPGFYAALDRLMETSAVSLHRDVLRDPLAIEHALQGSAKKYAVNVPLQQRAIWKLGYAKASAAAIARQKAAHLITVRDKQLVNFNVGKSELDAYVHTLSSLERQGIKVVVVIMPVPTGYIGAHPHGVTDWNAWKSTVTQAAEQLSVPVLDMSRTMPDSAFRDYEHLDVPPARSFTKLLATRLRELGV